MEKQDFSFLNKKKSFYPQNGQETTYFRHRFLDSVDDLFLDLKISWFGIKKPSPRSVTNTKAYLSTCRNKAGETLSCIYLVTGIFFSWGIATIKKAGFVYHFVNKKHQQQKHCFIQLNCCLYRPMKSTWNTMAAPEKEETVLNTRT